MNASLRKFIFFITLIFFSGIAQANSKFNYWPIEEKLPDGRIHFKVIEEDPSLRANQSQISQRIIYDVEINANEVPKNISSIIANAKAEVFPRTGKPLWVPTKNAWSQADEDAYSAWFASIDETYDSGGAVGDCADIGLLFRWTYARDHLLPIANTLIGGKLFGHFSTDADWDALPTDADWKKDQRFLAALKYLFDHTYTRTIVTDIYPTIVSSQYVRPGSMFMIIRPNDGHTQTIHQIGNDVGVITFWGNEPSAAQVYSSAIDIETQNKMTIGLWREVRLNAAGNWELTPSTEMPGYSLSQFQQNFSDDDGRNDGLYQDWFFAQIGITVPNSQKLNDLLYPFVTDFYNRTVSTANSLAFCVPTQCAPNTAEYNNDSTFALDAKIASEQYQIATLIQALGPNDPTVKNFQTFLQQYGELITGSGLTYSALAANPALIKSFNSDPRVSYEARWGLAATTPTAKFNLESDAFLELLDTRINEVDGHLNTAHLDSGIKTVYQILQVDAPISQVDPAAVTAFRKTLSQYGLSFSDPSCANASGCTLDDLIFGGNVETHFQKWSPLPQDATPLRWGY